tara:strand:- start:100 stop:339 length:240 start_codon:yes stop_codon:yes gene_type:complete
MGNESVCVRAYKELWEMTSDALQNAIWHRAHLKRNAIGKYGRRYCKGFEHLRKAETIFASVLTDIEDEIKEEVFEDGKM